jgi:phosphotransacetylase
MPLPELAELFRQADGLPAPVPVAVAGGTEVTVLEALRTACDRGWVRPVLAGREADVRRLAAECGVSLHGFTLLDSDEPARTAVAAVRAGDARLLLKGQVATPELLAAVLDRDTGLRAGQVICQVVLMELPRDRRRFLLADTGICPRPTLDEKAALIRHAAAVARALGEPCPRVALLAATETPTERMPDTLEAAELQRRGAAGAFPGCVVQGPLSFDLAYAPEAAAKKGVAGPVAGAASALIFPSLAAANLTVKAIMYTADCHFGGLLCGAACPVVFMSRADSTTTRLNSLALTLAYHRSHSSKPCEER